MTRKRASGWRPFTGPGSYAAGALPNPSARPIWNSFGHGAPRGRAGIHFIGRGFWQSATGGEFSSLSTGFLEGNLSLATARLWGPAWKAACKPRGRGKDASCLAPPARIRTGAIDAYYVARQSKGDTFWKLTAIRS